MKKLKWTTETIYVEKETGQILTKTEAKENYLIIKKIKNATINQRYIREKNGSQTLTKFGIITITNECTKSGTQGKLF